MVDQCLLPSHGCHVPEVLTRWRNMIFYFEAGWLCVKMSAPQTAIQKQAVHKYHLQLQYPKLLSFSSLPFFPFTHKHFLAFGEFESSFWIKKSPNLQVCVLTLSVLDLDQLQLQHVQDEVPCLCGVLLVKGTQRSSGRAERVRQTVCSCGRDGSRVKRWQRESIRLEETKYLELNLLKRRAN